MLINGFPRPASSYVKIGGVRTSFRMPDTLSIALGGGSLVSIDEETESVTIGPQSVGYKLKKEAKCFGGSFLTTTDIAVAKGYAKIDGADPSKV